MSDVADIVLYSGVVGHLTAWGRVVVRGAHAERFLHSQLTSDVKGLAEREGGLSALLDRTGRLRSFFLLARFGDRFELVTPPGLASMTARRVAENVIADDVDVEVAAEEAGIRLVVGPSVLAESGGGLDPERSFSTGAFGAAGVVTWGGGAGAGLPELSRDELETLMVAAGVPRWGFEADDGVPLNETMLVETATSFSKGCFLGQETVAKIQSNRGAVRYPTALVTEGPAPAVTAGTPFEAGGRSKAGTVLAVLDWGGGKVVTASLHRGLRVEGRLLECRTPDGSVFAGRVRTMPLLAAEPRDTVSERLYHRGVGLFQADREGEAMELLERAIAVDPGCADAYESLGVILGRHERYDEAIGWMRRLLEVDPDSVMAHTNMSLYHMRSGRIEEAEEEARQAALAEMRRRRTDQERERAEREAVERRLAEAGRREAMFRQVLDLDSEDALANFGMGELLLERGEHAASVDHLERALAADPRYSAALLALGRAHHGLGDAGRAREAFTRCVDVAASRGDLAVANKAQEALTRLGPPHDQRSAAT